MDTLPLPIAALERRLGYEEGSLDGADKIRAEDALEDATAIALGMVPAHVAEKWTKALPRAVAVVILKAARREYENPQGAISENLGEHAVTLGVATGVFLTETERAEIRRAALGRTGFVGSVRTPSAYGDGR